HRVLHSVVQRLEQLKRPVVHISRGPRHQRPPGDVPSLPDLPEALAEVVLPLRLLLLSLTRSGTGGVEKRRGTRGLIRPSQVPPEPAVALLQPDVDLGATRPTRALGEVVAERQPVQRLVRDGQGAPP